MRILGGGPGLAGVVLIYTSVDGYELQHAHVASEAVPIERRVLAYALRDLADAIEVNAEEVGD